ncbi:unnamed protein product [Acanthoscelides obtectus]|uniref:DNA mismatch repair proteins mutS family domain-containing protein n=1 Tax=Acanthoscelides obtectus TaxID=200917 RepID=A0A9P0K6Z8_ACAOB|nr:unnamed protein product [Acanthoscelides obtectus]CAK1666864.1 DNA mismatch repair protein MutS [Acanthoscelides obtectus]
MLLQVMAQVGCYVPAQSAMFKPADLMFARIYLDDNMEYGASSFVLESHWQLLANRENLGYGHRRIS